MIYDKVIGKIIQQLKFRSRSRRAETRPEVIRSWGKSVRVAHSAGCCHCCGLQAGTVP